MDLESASIILTILINSAITAGVVYKKYKKRN